MWNARLRSAQLERRRLRRKQTASLDVIPKCDSTGQGKSGVVLEGKNPTYCHVEASTSLINAELNSCLAIDAIKARLVTLVKEKSRSGYHNVT